VTRFGEKVTAVYHGSLSVFPAHFVTIRIILPVDQFPSDLIMFSLTLLQSNHGDLMVSPITVNSCSVLCSVFFTRFTNAIIVKGLDID